LLHAMHKDADVPLTRLKGKKYMKEGLVIIDDVGFEAFTREEANLFFRPVIFIPNHPTNGSAWPPRDKVFSLGTVQDVRGTANGLFHHCTHSGPALAI
jgi:hypothetical protein